MIFGNNIKCPLFSFFIIVDIMFIIFIVTPIRFIIGKINIVKPFQFQQKIDFVSNFFSTLLCVKIVVVFKKCFIQK